ncbi:hypothetical protein M413DRAFT_284851 [Hebeloma cylindrosporum]|uniref:Uncharacterized protein n=1 Tax=Hebeloma cylindrosporum TaxID=76867 RepID=A0A0C3BXK8_HEBCY|nr:hypothetical protein M413DRAFT_284851 [Hebeloma cylindrosporum h7]
MFLFNSQFTAFITGSGEDDIHLLPTSYMSPHADRTSESAPSHHLLFPPVETFLIESSSGGPFNEDIKFSLMLEDVHAPAQN